MIRKFQLNHIVTNGINDDLIMDGSGKILKINLVLREGISVEILTMEGDILNRENRITTICGVL